MYSIMSVVYITKTFIFRLRLWFFTFLVEVFVYYVVLKTKDSISINLKSINRLIYLLTKTKQIQLAQIQNLEI